MCQLLVKANIVSVETLTAINSYYCPLSDYDQQNQLVAWRVTLGEFKGQYVLRKNLDNTRQIM